MYFLQIDRIQDASTGKLFVHQLHSRTIRLIVSNQYCFESIDKKNCTISSMHTHLIQNIFMTLLVDIAKTDIEIHYEYVERCSENGKVVEISLSPYS